MGVVVLKKTYLLYEGAVSLLLCIHRRNQPGLFGPFILERKRTWVLCHEKDIFAVCVSRFYYISLDRINPVRLSCSLRSSDPQRCDRDGVNSV